MKRGIKFCKKFISFFLAVMMIYSFGFKGVVVWAWGSSDTTPPTLILTSSATDLTSGSLTITATANDNVGVYSITKPDKTVVYNTNTTTYLVSSYGSYTFVVQDKSGNTTTKIFTVDANNGVWNAENIVKNTNEAQLMVRYGDIDNFGYGWGTIDPFSGNSTTPHGYPFQPSSDDINYAYGTDKIMVTSGYNAALYPNNANNYIKSKQIYDKTINKNVTVNLERTDGYTKSYPNNKATAIQMQPFARPNNINDATLELFVDDFAAGHYADNGAIPNHISQVHYKAYINNMYIPELSDLINQLNQSGPIGKLITFEIPKYDIDKLFSADSNNNCNISIKIDDNETQDYSDGYSIDFIKLLINKKGPNSNSGTIWGYVKNEAGDPIGGATVYVNGDENNYYKTGADGYYKLEYVPAGSPVIRAVADTYDPQSYSETLVSGKTCRQDFSLSQTGPKLTLTQSPDAKTYTNGTVTITATGTAGTNPVKRIILPDGTTISGAVAQYQVSSNGTYKFEVDDSARNSNIQTIKIDNIDTTPPVLTLSKSPTDSTNGTVTITATATDNVAVASITKPDNTLVTDSSTTYTVNSNGAYSFTATDTAGNVTTQSINISNIGSTNTNDTSLPNISASLESATPNPAKSTDDITLKYDIKAVDPFTLPSETIDEAVVLEDMSKDMLENSRWSMYQDGLPNKLLDNLVNSNIKFGIVGYNDFVYVGSRENEFNEPKTQNLKKTDENLSNIDTTKFFPFFGLDNGNVKDGYRQFYQERTNIYNNISNNHDREFGTALKVADKLLTQYGTADAKKAIIIISSGNLSYTDAEIKNIKNKGYKIITMDVSNSSSTNIRDTHIKLSGNQLGYIDNYYKGTFNDQSNYNSTDDDMKKVAQNLKGEIDTSSLSIKDAKLNIDLGENFDAANSSSGLEGSGRIRTVTIPEINFTKNADGKWIQTQPIEVAFKVKPASDKYGELGFGLYTNVDNTTHTNSSTISYTNFYNIATNKAIETPTINITNPTKTKPDKPVITSDPTTQTTGKVTVTISYSSDSVTKKYRINDGTTTGDWQTYSGPFEVSKNCTIEAKGIDSAGTESDIASYDINNIVAAPDMPVINVSPTTFTNDKDIVTITYSDDSTIKQYRIKTGTTTGDWQTYTEPFDVTENCTIEAKGTNQYHIESQTASCNIKNIDKIAPSGTTISLNSNNQVVITSGVDNDGGSGVKEVKYKIYSGSTSDNDQTWTTYQNSFDPNMQVFTVQAKTIDNAGNESSVVTQTFDMASIIIKHGIYDVKSNQNDYININNKVSNGIPISIAMVINAKAFNPTIDLNIGNTSKISDQNINSGIDVKEYEISNGSIGSLINEKYLGINNSSISISSSDGFVMNEGHEYIMIYTITPKGSANDTIDMTATVRNTSNSNRLELQTQDMPDLF
ncbi:carboxypeptidase regulatory-like domain-containing protein [Clostridium beijerinckii]|uniref:VWFA domain-containing protein n=1 Tax=Clostridium beijerinckii TaxID=1520 RepID=A0A1S8S013_CLOBE|nr:carboxypeptidase regulatory-like domain-containing protein [Clostridium beijerinckii]NRY59953.1 hypothetical protein [Clostridium beijerinckii]OOM58781.1 hypothetical protein CLBCK_38170 [Clostridium beijerinckii]